MQHKTLRLLLLFLLLHPLTSAGPEDVDVVSLEVIVDSSPCSVTCGLGVRNQTLCLLKDSLAAMEEHEGGGAEVPQVSQECRVRRVKCGESWRCGLRTMTVTSGQRVEMDCLGDVMEAMGRFSWRVSWRYARGVISSDDSLFARWDAPLLDRVVLDPVGEEDAGTYRCDVKDATSHRVKRVYWGVRVLPDGVFNLDYNSSLAQWDSQLDQTASDQHHRMPLHHVALISLGVAGVSAGIILSGLYCALERRRLASQAC